MTSYHGQTLRNIVYYHNMQYEIHPRSQSQENGQNAFSWIINEREFFRTNGQVRFFPSLCWSFMPSFVKILRLVFRENCLYTDRPTDRQYQAWPQLTLRTVACFEARAQRQSLPDSLTSWHLDFFTTWLAPLFRYGPPLWSHLSDLSDSAISVISGISVISVISVISMISAISFISVISVISVISAISVISLISVISSHLGDLSHLRDISYLSDLSDLSYLSDLSDISVLSDLSDLSDLILALLCINHANYA